MRLVELYQCLYMDRISSKVKNLSMALFQNRSACAQKLFQKDRDSSSRQHGSSLGFGTDPSFPAMWIFHLWAGSRRMFGSVLEKDVCVLLDVSGSMAPCLPELQKGLTLLIWDQLHANSVRWTLFPLEGDIEKSFSHSPVHHWLAEQMMNGWMRMDDLILLPDIFPQFWRRLEMWKGSIIHLKMFLPPVMISDMLSLLAGVLVTDVCVRVRFNVLAFSGGVRMWQPALVESTEDLCTEAVQWLSQLSSHGASSTLQALQVLTATLTTTAFYIYCYYIGFMENMIVIGQWQHCVL